MEREAGNFRSVHLQLDEMMTEYRAWSDVVAERIVAIGVAADGVPARSPTAACSPLSPTARSATMT